MGNLYAPNGVKITGTRELVPATSAIEDGSVVKTEAGYGFQFVGQTDLDWDNQTTEVINGQQIYVDEDGEEWPEDQLEYRENG